MLVAVGLILVTNISVRPLFVAYAAACVGKFADVVLPVT
jgi:hypothetical protein